MSTTIAGMLNLANSSRAITSIGTDVVFNTLNEYMSILNGDMQSLTNLFVDPMRVEKPSMYIQTPGSGYLQKYPQGARPENIDVLPGYTVSFPLEGMGAAIGGDRISLAYMTVADLDNVLLTVQRQAINTYRKDILTKLFAAGTSTFVDPIFGSLTLQPLANGDTVKYPVLGGVDAVDTHQLYPNYALTSVSSTNNPLSLMWDELAEHWGNPEIVFLAGLGVVNQLKSTFATDFVEVAETGINYGSDSTTASLGGVSIPGKLVGKFKTYGWMSLWRHIPANYMIAIALGTPQPLRERVDPESTGLPRGLTLIAEDERMPFKNSYFDMRYGLGVAGRISAAVLQFGSGGSYAAPTVY